MLDVLTDFGQNFAIALALAFVFSSFSKYLLANRGVVPALLTGGLFGIAGILSMAAPLRFLDGMAIDNRMVTTALAGTFGGPLAATTAIALEGSFRIHQGGAGTLAGEVMLALSGVLGCLFRWERIKSIQATHGFLLLGLLLAVVGLATTLVLPTSTETAGLKWSFLPVLVFYPVGVGLFGVLFCFEITRREAIESLLQRESQVRTLADNLQGGMIYQVIMGRDGGRRFTYLSDAVKSFYGISPTEGMANAQLLYRQIHPQDAQDLADTERSAAEALSTFKAEARVFNPDGAVRWSSFVSNPTVQRDGTIRWDGLEFDITSRKAAEEERRVLDERVNNLQKLEALGVLVAGVAHNINNVLTAILGAASMGNIGARESAADKEAFEIISTASRRGRDVVRSLMQFARPTLTNRAPVELHCLLTELRTLLENTSRNRLRIHESHQEEQLWVLGDAGNLSTAFMNLCLNAIDAMPEGGDITFSTRPIDLEWIEVRIDDTGEGMPPEVLHRVLEPFFTTKSVGKGTGLGMSITHGAIKAHGGTLDISSQPGKGTSVVIRLPRLAHPTPEATQPLPDRIASLRIFLVDDDPKVLFLVARMLQAQGHQVRSFSSGREVLDGLVVDPAPDLIILDQNMPDMDGIQTMARIKSLHREVPILISSGQPDIQEWECFKQPLVSVLPKPFDMDELQEALGRIAHNSFS